MPSGDTSFDSYDFDAPRGRPTNREAKYRDGLSSIDSGSYSPDKFYVASTNEHDHDESMRIRMPKWLAVYSQDIIRSPQLPAYRSMHDLVRDAMVHRVKYIHDHGLTDSDLDWIEREILQGALARIESRRQNKLENVDLVKTTLAEAVRSEDLEELEMAVSVAQGMAEHIGQPYADNIREAIAYAYTSSNRARNVPTEVMFR